MEDKKRVVIIDTEIYTNYFLLTAKAVDTGAVKHYELSDKVGADITGIKRLMENYTTVSFNGLAFDIPIIKKVVSGATNKAIKQLCDTLIMSDDSLEKWGLRNIGTDVSLTWDHIDLIGLTAKGSSLKVLGGRMFAPKLQDLPFEPSKILTYDDMEAIKAYCINDVNTTEMLYNKLSGPIKLRETMSVKYGVDLRSKSDAQIAEAILKHDLFVSTGKVFTKPKPSQIPKSVRYDDPGVVKFTSDTLNNLMQDMINAEFVLDKTSSPIPPDTLKARVVEIGGVNYSVGLGGLHSKEKGKFYKETAKKRLFELDGESFYPSIMLQQGIFPDLIGPSFLEVLADILKTRLHAKHNSIQDVADALKIAVNGLFGKLGSVYSFLFAPKLLLQTTLTGQLLTLMLIEMLVDKGISVVSANTDGIVVYCDVKDMDIVQEVREEWMLRASIKLDKTDYSCIAARDVNNYLAIKKNGDIKRKGVFAIGGLSKNLDRNICYTAVVNLVSKGIPLDTTIMECKDINQFFLLKKRSKMTEWDGIKLGKTVRYYFSTEVPNDIYIHDCDTDMTKGSKVTLSEGSRPLMDLPDVFPTDIDYERYITFANTILKDVGYGY